MLLPKCLTHIFTANRREIEQQGTPTEQKFITKETGVYFSAVKAFESDRISLAHKSAKIAWKLCGVFAVIAVLALLALVGLTPLKAVVPFVIRVDNNTGAADIATPIGNAQSSYGQEVDKYFLAKFIINHESYDWDTAQSMSDMVQLMSDSAVMNQYEKRMLDKDHSPMYQLKSERKLATRVTSISFIGDIAQIRFTKTVIRNDGSEATEYQKSGWIATVAFDYQKEIRLENERLINPLGFRVISYRLDPESMRGKP